MSAPSLSGHVLAVGLALSLLFCAALYGQLRRSEAVNAALASHVEALLRACQEKLP